MLLATCAACRSGQHDRCSGERPPPPGMIGGSKCDCDGDCAGRQDPDAVAFVDKMLDAMKTAEARA